MQTSVERFGNSIQGLLKFGTFTRRPRQISCDRSWHWCLLLRMRIVMATRLFPALLFSYAALPELGSGATPHPRLVECGGGFHRLEPDSCVTIVEAGL